MVLLNRPLFQKHNIYLLSSQNRDSLVSNGDGLIIAIWN